jgi:acetylornithine deacetylase/succinyl-diaminopimelate desuccinylase-like protein
LKPICDEHGITEFRDEPYTDVVQIRKKTPIMCYNVGNGGYNAHLPNEYLIVEDAQAAYKFGLDLLNNIGENRYWFSDN